MAPLRSGFGSREELSKANPLSPLLFALAYDPLLTKLSSIPRLRPFGFADDMALASACFKALVSAMKLIMLFSGASGLGVNTDKTILVCTRANRSEAEALAASSPWPDLVVAFEFVYLGILMGRRVSTRDVYAKALVGMQAKASAFLPTVRTMSHPQRVAVFNIFLFSKLTYIMNFYSIPYGYDANSLNVVVREIAMRLIPNFNRAYPYVFLIQPPDRLGPSPPVRDVWNVSTATLAAQADLSLWDGITSVSRAKGDTRSMLISEHVRASVTDFISWHLAGLEREGLPVIFRAADFQCSSVSSTRRRLHARLRLVANAEDQDSMAREVLARRGLPCSQTAVDLINSHFSAAPSGLAPRFRRTTFHLLFNALATSKRCQVLFHPTRAARRALTPTPCFLCHGHADYILHLFGGGCLVVNYSRQLFSAAIGIDLSPDTLLAGHTFNMGDDRNGPSLTPPPQEGAEANGPPTVISFCDLTTQTPTSTTTSTTTSSSTAHSSALPLLSTTDAALFRLTSHLLFKDNGNRAGTAILVFNATVWSQRGTFFKTQGVTDRLSPTEAANRIASVASSAFRSQMKPRASRFGNSSSRTDSQKAAARAHAKALLAAVPDGDAVAYTDGSALGNPGPAGAGAYSFVKGSQNHFYEFIGPLGQGTNNLGELWAIGAALDLLTRLPTPGRPYFLHVFSDSQFAIDVIQGSSCSWEHADLIYNIRAKLYRLIASGIAKGMLISWVPGNAEVQENEHVDDLAKRGARLSQKKQRLINIPLCLQNGIFAPD